MSETKRPARAKLCGDCLTPVATDGLCPVCAAENPKCVCGHLQSSHLTKRGDGRCLVDDCDCGPGTSCPCIPGCCHEGFHVASGSGALVKFISTPRRDGNSDFLLGLAYAQENTPAEHSFPWAEVERRYREGQLEIKRLKKLHRHNLYDARRALGTAIAMLLELEAHELPEYVVAGIRTGLSKIDDIMGWDQKTQREGEFIPGTHIRPTVEVTPAPHMAMAVYCLRCRLQKAPLGRDVPVAMGGSMCDHECPGYLERPAPECRWPGETVCGPGCTRGQLPRKEAE